MLFDPFGDFANNDRPDNSMNNEDPYGLEEAFNELKGEENLSEYLSDSELDDKDPYGLEEALNELENGKNSQNYKRNLSSDSESESEEIANNPSTNIQSFNYKKKFIERYELSQK